MRRLVVISGLVAMVTSARAATPRLPPDDAREQGLAPLRAALGLSTPSGHVVTDASGAWLVHTETGQRLVRWPDAWTGEAVSGHGAQTLLFEGAPGAALVFDHDTVGLARLDRLTGQVAWSRVFAPALPAATPLLTTRRAGKTSAVFLDEDEPKVTHIALDGRPEGATVTLTLTGLQVNAGARDGELLFELSDTTILTTPCSGDLRGSVQLARSATGTTLLRYESASTTVGVGEPSCAGRDRLTPTTIVKHLLWIELRPPAVTRVVWEDSEHRETAETPVVEIKHRRVVDLPGAELVYEGEAEDTWPYGTSYWIWNVVPANGAPIGIVSGT